MVAGQKEGSSSSEHFTSEEQTRREAGFRGYNFSQPSGVVLNDVPGYGDQTSSLLRPQAGGINSPYPTITNAPSPRSRAHTDSVMQAVQQQGTPGTPSGGMQQNAWQMSGQRHFSEQRYPPPPPLPTQASGSHGMQLPQLPPPPPLSNQLPGPPPRPSQPNTHQGWNRQHGYQAQHREPRAYDPMAYSEYMQLPPLPPDNQPLTSATYIPGNDSFGPGVGIPPLQPQTTPMRPSIQQQHNYYRGQANEYPAHHDVSAQVWQQQQQQQLLEQQQQQQLHRYGGDRISQDQSSWLSNNQHNQNHRSQLPSQVQSQPQAHPYPHPSTLR